MTKIFIPGIAVPKQRPRVTRNGTFMPMRYLNYQQEVVNAFNDLDPVDLPMHLHCLFINFVRGDLDNLIGSIMDGMVKSGFIANDNHKHIGKISGQYANIKKQRGKEKIQGVLVIIEPYSPESDNALLHRLMETQECLFHSSC